MPFHPPDPWPGLCLRPWGEELQERPRHPQLAKALLLWLECLHNCQVLEWLMNKTKNYWNPICSWWYHYHTYEDPIDISPWWCTYPSGARPSGEARQDCFPSDPEISFVPMVGIRMIKVSQLLFRFMEFLVTATGQMWPTLMLVQSTMWSSAGMNRIRRTRQTSHLTLQLLLGLNTKRNMQTRYKGRLQKPDSRNFSAWGVLPPPFTDGFFPKR